MKLLTPLLSCALGASILSAQTAPADLAQLTRGVETITSPGSPGRVSVFGDAAFPVIVGNASRGVLQTVVGATRLGGGRVVAFGHNGYFGIEAVKEGTFSWHANPALLAALAA